MANPLWGSVAASHACVRSQSHHLYNYPNLISNLKSRPYITLPSTFTEFLKELAGENYDKLKTYTATQRSRMTSRRLNIINKLKARFPKKTITFNDHTIPDWFNSEGLPLSVKGQNNRYLVPWDEGVCNKTFWQFLQWRKVNELSERSFWKTRIRASERSKQQAASSKQQAASSKQS